MMTREDVPGDRPEHERRDWRERDLERAIGVAEKADLTSYRVEIAPDGTISIVVGEPASDIGDPSGLDP